METAAPWPAAVNAKRDEPQRALEELHLFATLRTVVFDGVKVVFKLGAGKIEG